MKKQDKKKGSPRPVTKRPTKKPEELLPEPHRLHSIVNDVVLNYQRHRVGAALPWDHERHAVRTSWAKLSNDIGPRESGRGIRNGR